MLFRVNRLFTEAASDESCGSPVMTGALVFLCLYPPWIVPRPLQPPLTHQLFTTVTIPTNNKLTTNWTYKTPQSKRWNLHNIPYILPSLWHNLITHKFFKCLSVICNQSHSECWPLYFPRIHCSWYSFLISTQHFLCCWFYRFQRWASFLSLIL